MCIYILKDVINYYNVHRSPVFCCFLDVSKAFDRVNHAILFKKMLRRGIPMYIVQFIAFWYQSQELQIRWGKTFSDSFFVTNGIRQGGILSPYLFNIVLDDLSIKLNQTNVGCFVGSFLLSHLSYADDMVLIAPSAKALQILLSICEEYARQNDIVYNTDKSKCIIFWPKVNVSDQVRFLLQGMSLKIVEQIKYLGVYIDSNLSDDCEISKRSRGIYAAGNTIISNFGKCNSNCKILMFKTYCYNVYGISLWASYRVSSYAKAKVAHNDIFRTLMNVHRSESATKLFAEHNVSNLDVISRNCMFSLMQRLLCSSNVIVKEMCGSNVRLHSKIWKRWSIALGVDWESLMNF